ncbi:VOC family protein [uncultured Nitratireductor sp.]|uniref:VOC family protein n=1 Tax=uncultured Nitratireductor sp. TaxID=520953 RepID=UPI0025EF42E8|nr:VOC family protein [uncultured Nitratireductor sp.]
MLKIAVTSILVDDQDKAEAFYTDVLGFQKKQDFPVGGARWLTVVTPGAENGTELLLEPMGYEFARTYQKALYDAGVPCTTFASEDVWADYERMSAKGVTFRGEPSQAEGFPTTAVFEDTCGNLVQIFEEA